MQAKYPDSDLSRYFAYLAAAIGTDHDHHIAPKAEFPELADDRENIISLSFQEHFYAHYLLALAVPECSPYQTTVRFMANVFAHELRTDELPFFAEVYERGMRALKAAQRTPEARARNSAALKKHFEDPEARARTSAALKKHFEDPEARARQSAALKKRYENPEARARTSAALKKRFEDPEARARQSAVQKKRFEDPEERARMSAAIKKYWASYRAERFLADALISTVHADVLKAAAK